MSAFRAAVQSDGNSDPADLTNRLVGMFRNLLAEGVFRPGARLPPERALAQQLSVNRASLRHALTALETMGVITRRVGDGTYFSADSQRILAVPMDFLILLDGISFEDLMDARIVIEPALAARAAVNASEDGMGRIRATLNAMQGCGNDLDGLVRADASFHEAIAAASGNITCQRLFTAVHHSLLQFIRLNSELETVPRKIAVHRGIFQAIQSRDAEAASARMLAHLETSLAHFRAEDRKRQRKNEQVKVARRLARVSLDRG